MCFSPIRRMAKSCLVGCVPFLNAPTILQGFVVRSPIRRVSKIVPRRVCSVFERTNNIARFCGAITNPVGRDWCAFHQSAGYPNRVRRIDQMRVNLALPIMHAGVSGYRQKSHPGGRDWCAFHQSAEWQNRVRRIDQMRVNLALPFMHAGVSRYRQNSHPVGRDWCAFHQSAGVAKSCLVGCVPFLNAPTMLQGFVVRSPIRRMAFHVIGNNCIL